MIVTNRRRGSPRERSSLRRLRVEPLEPRTLLSAGGWPGTVIHDASGNLFTVDLRGEMAVEYVDNTGVVLFDMAFSPLDKLYGVTLPDGGWPSELYSFAVDFESANPQVVPEFIGTISMGIGQGIYVNSLEFNGAGELFAAGHDVLGQNFLFKIDPDTAGAERVLDLDFHASAGDLAFDSHGNLYLTTTFGDLLKIPPEQDSFEVVGQTQWEGSLVTDLFGLVFGPAPLMHGFGTGGDVYRIDPALGEAVLVGQITDPQLDFIYGAATVFPPPADLGAVDFQELPGQEPTLGELWYRVEPTRDAVLTVDLPNVDPGAQIALSLHQLDPQGELVQLPTQDLGDLRLDYEYTVAGAEYFVEIEGAESNVDVRVTNLVQPRGNGAFVYGTDRNDTFQFAPGPPYTIIINGVNYPYNFSSNSLVAVSFDGGIGHDVAELTGSSRVDVARLSLGSFSGDVTRSRYYRVAVTGTPEISFDGRGGNDSATLVGTGFADTITLRPGSASVAGSSATLKVANVARIDVNGGPGADSATFTGTPDDETVDLRYLEADFSGSGFSTSVASVESISAVGGGGHDTADLSGSPGQDRFKAHPSWASLSGTGFSLRVSDFDAVSAHATPGGNDVAQLWGTPTGIDTFQATPEYGLLSGLGYSNRAESFRYVHAYGDSVPGAGDVALLHGDPNGQDTFEAWPDQAKLYGQTYYTRALAFRYVHAYSTPGNNDVALFNGDPGGQDIFKAWPEQAKLYGPGYYNRVKSFRYVHAFSTAGETDVALLYDAPGAQDTFEAWPEEAKIHGTGYYNRVKSFRYVHAFSTAGDNDLALLHDSPDQADTFQAFPDQARLYGAGYFARAKSFRYVHAYATPGYDDVARFYDDPGGNDTFEAWPDQAKLYGAGYFARAKSFRYVHATASRSGNDQAILHDSALTDYLQAAENWAKLFDQAVSFVYRTADFDSVTAISTTPGDTKTVAAVDYLLNLQGFWQDP